MSDAIWITKHFARGLVLSLSISGVFDGGASAQQAATIPQAEGNPTATNIHQSPAPSGGPATDTTAGGPPDAPTTQTDEQNSPVKNIETQTTGETRPLGTAAAPYTKPTGVTGSRPAGAVIAPAKQRRVRAILISVGVVAAAGIAIGAVAGLSHASPSRPN